jgi:branched-chain amino acid transport system substrate-binding protein
VIMKTLPSRAQPGSLAHVLAAAALVLLWASPALAQSPIVVGQSCDLSSATAPRVKEYVKGVDAYIERVNAKGGVAGRPIKLLRYDDAFKAEKGLENAKRLVEQDNAMILFGMGSAPSMAAILPYATEKGVPVFGSLSGADSLRKPNPLLFHFRASFSDEIDRLAKHFSTIGIKKVAALAADLPIGKDGVVALEAAAKEHGLEMVKIARVAADLKNLDESADAIAKTDAQAVLILAPAGPGIKFTEALQKNKVFAQLAGLSVMSSDSLYKALGEKARGIIITQIVPYPWSSRYAITQDYQKLMAEAKIPLSVDTMEGYMSARLLVEGLKAAGAAPTRASFIAGLEGLNRKDVGDLQVSFSPKDRSLIKLVDITMIGRDGKLVN